MRKEPLDSPQKTMVGTQDDDTRMTMIEGKAGPEKKGQSTALLCEVLFKYQIAECMVCKASNPKSRQVNPVKSRCRPASKEVVKESKALFLHVIQNDNVICNCNTPTRMCRIASFPTFCYMRLQAGEKRTNQKKQDENFLLSHFLTEPFIPVPD